MKEKTRIANGDINKYLLVKDPSFTAYQLQTDSEYVSQFTIVYK